MKIRSIHIYPIKGLGAISLQSTKVLERGLQYDRRWMLVDEAGEFITQRTNSKLALFNCELGSQLKVIYKDKSLFIDIDTITDNRIQTTVWDNQVDAYEVDEKVSIWFSEILGMKCRLVKMVDAHNIYKKLIKGPDQTKVSFADGYPYLILGTASVDHLSDKVGRDIPADRFRANIIIETTEPHIEDTWDELQIGTSKFLVIKPCARCNVVNIDQSTGEVNKEPLKSLSAYRLDGNVVNFGACTICLSEGVISVDDDVVVINK